MYYKLRKNLVENVFGEWEKMGFAREQYNPETGAGQTNAAFHRLDKPGCEDHDDG